MRPKWITRRSCTGDFCDGVLLSPNKLRLEQWKDSSVPEMAPLSGAGRPFCYGFPSFMSEGKLEPPEALPRFSGMTFLTPLTGHPPLLSSWRELAHWERRRRTDGSGVDASFMSEKRKARRAAFSSVRLFPVSFEHSFWNLDLEFFCLFFLFQVNSPCFVCVKSSSEVLMVCKHLFFYATFLHSLYLLSLPARPTKSVDCLCYIRSKSSYDQGTP